jgi:hypothetical protein
MPDDLRKAAAKLFACPNWQNRIGEWADIKDAVARLYAAFRAATDRPAEPEPELKQLEDLLAMGGKFYTMGGESWCDTAVDSWKLVPERGGFVRFDDTTDPKGS